MLKSCSHHVRHQSPGLRLTRSQGSPPCKSPPSPTLQREEEIAPNTPAQAERDITPPASNEVQVAVQSTGLCGSDLHYFNHYRNGDIIVREPLTLGHESAGTVVAAGDAVSNLKPGDRVALEVGQPCDECEYCTGGRYNICRNMKFRSSAKAFPHAQGTLQERVNAPAKWCHK